MTDYGRYFEENFVNLEDHEQFIKAHKGEWDQICTIVHNTIADWHQGLAFIDCGRYSEFARCIRNQLFLSGNTRQAMQPPSDGEVQEALRIADSRLEDVKSLDFGNVFWACGILSKFIRENKYDEVKTQNHFMQENTLKTNKTDIVTISRDDFDYAIHILEVLQRPIHDVGDWRRGWDAAIGMAAEALSILENAQSKQVETVTVEELTKQLGYVHINYQSFLNVISKRFPNGVRIVKG